ncbi:MAG TPA: hypothetical protein VHF69_02765, partial [Candidatus Synoicihabitans sp.]|nr:hypothetical protein [Candidatus Synoicihabitans sp.]
MTSHLITPEDPRLTAYAFGELEGDELAAVEAAIAADPALQAAVAELRALGAELQTVLTDEPPSVAAAPVSRAVPSLERTKVTRFPYYLVSGLVAAGFAVLVAVRDPQSPMQKHEEVMHLELSLPTASAVEPEEIPNEGDVGETAGEETVTPEVKHVPAPTQPSLAETFAPKAEP